MHDTYYHATRRSRLASILTHGLDPARCTDTDEPVPVVFLGRDQGTARAFAPGGRYWIGGSTRDPMVLLAVTVPSRFPLRTRAEFVRSAGSDTATVHPGGVPGVHIGRGPMTAATVRPCIRIRARVCRTVTSYWLPEHRQAMEREAIAAGFDVPVSTYGSDAFDGRRGAHGR